MATAEQRHALLSATCPWCSAPPGEVCSMPAPGQRKRDEEGGVRRERRIPISTLDAGCHDARWHAAGLGSAPVRADVVAALHISEKPPAREPAMAGRVPALFAEGERPW